MVNEDAVISATISWIEKYSPSKIDEIVCNRKAVFSIQSWLHNFNKTKRELYKNNKSNADKNINKKLKKNVKSCIIVTGNHGIGKTVSVKVILEQHGYIIETVNFRNINTNKDIKNNIKSTLKSSNISDLINGNPQSKTAIVIDEIESITSTTEKNYILALLKYNDINWICPVIFISNNQHNKLLSDIKKNSLEVRFWPPFDSDMRKILIKIVKSERIKIKSERVVDIIINHVQADIRRLIYTLRDVKYAYPNNVITPELMNEYCEMSKKKDIDIDLYKATDGLLYNYTTIDDCLRYYETEKVLLPLMVHQHYAKSILLNYKNDDDRYKMIQNISESLSIGDIVENYIYGDQNWDMQEIHGYYTCVAPSFEICHNIKGEPEKTKLSFATDLNKTSIKKINKKNINNTSKCFEDMNIIDYIYINKIIRKLIDNNEIEMCVEIVSSYGARIEHIESLLKIDKIKNTKVNLSSKQKKEFIKYLN
jgi:DNA polymerase III delta prime subunit